MSFLAAAVQMSSGTDKQKNLDAADLLVRRAAQRGATFVALPEMFACLGEPASIVSSAEPEDGQVATRMGRLASELKITLLAGSFACSTHQSSRVTNTSLVFGPDGRRLARYDKRHLFDIELPGRVRFCESQFVAAGNEIIVAETPVGVLGQATCYDLRFPEMFRSLIDAGAEFLGVPAAFTLPTGRDHWEVLLRARAIENLCHVVAPNQHGVHAANMTSYGRSMIIDPWGVVLAQAADGPGVITAEIDLDRQNEIRANLPALNHRR